MRPAAAAVAILGAALLLRLPAMDRGFTEDELFTVANFVDGVPLETTLSNIGGFNNHIGHSLAARMAERAVGRSESALRLPALLLGLASFVVFWLLTRRLLGDGPGAAATLLLALSPPHVDGSTEARGYSGLLCLTLASSLLFLHLLERPKARLAVAYVLTTALAIYVHLYATFALGVQLLFLAALVIGQRHAGERLRSVHPRSVRLLIACVALAALLTFVLYLPALRDVLVSVPRRGRSGFNPGFPWGVLEFLYGGSWQWGALIAAATAAVGCRRLLRSHPLETLYCVALLIVPVAVMWLIRPRDLYVRFFAFALPYYLIFLVAGLIALWEARPLSRRHGAAPPVRVFAVGLTALLVVDWCQKVPRYTKDEGYRAATRRLTAGADDGVAFCAIGARRSMWRYYVRQPIAMPDSVTELEQLARDHGELRCLYYAGWWQGDAQTELARFLLEHGSAMRANATTTLFWLHAKRRPATPSNVRTPRPT